MMPMRTVIYGKSSADNGLADITMYELKLGTTKGMFTIFEALEFDNGPCRLRKAWNQSQLNLLSPSSIRGRRL